MARLTAVFLMALACVKSPGGAAAPDAADPPAGTDPEAPTVDEEIVVSDEAGWVAACAALSGGAPGARIRLDVVVRTPCAVRGASGVHVYGEGGFAAPAIAPADAWLSFVDTPGLVVRGLSFQGSPAETGVVSAISVRSADAPVTGVTLAELRVSDLGGGAADAVALSVWAAVGAPLRDVAITNNRVERLGRAEVDGNSHAVLVSTTPGRCVTETWTTCAPRDGVEAVGTDSRVERVLIARNNLQDVKLGSSEAIVVRGHVQDAAIVDNDVEGHDNIAIDVIGWEGDVIEARPDGTPRERRYFGPISRVAVVGNRVSGQSAPQRWGADFYADGASDVVFLANRSEGGALGVSLSAETELAVTLGPVYAVGNLVRTPTHLALVIGAEACSDDGAPIAAGLGRVVVHDNMFTFARRQAVLEAKGLIGELDWGRNHPVNPMVWADCFGVAPPASVSGCRRLDVDAWCAEHAAPAAPDWTSTEAPRWDLLNDHGWATDAGLLPGPDGAAGVPAYVDAMLAVAGG